MAKINKLTHTFVDSFPDVMEDGVIYISVRYCSAGHKCCCGCGREVVTPLSPTDWSLIFDGDTVSLHPSVGNWNFPCRSHYWIRKNRVKWARDWTESEIAVGRHFDTSAKKRYYGHDSKIAETNRAEELSVATTVSKTIKARLSFWGLIRRAISGQ